MAVDTLPMVLPVRFSGGGLAMQTTTSRLGAESAYVRSVVAPKVGARVELWLTVPNSPAPLKIDGTVAERAGAGQEAGFLARFEPLSTETSKYLIPFLQAHGVGPAPSSARQTKSDAEPLGSKRVYARLPTRLQVGWASPKEFLVAYSENLSRGGIFVATRNPPALREVVELLLELPDGQTPAKTQAEVVQSIGEEQAIAAGRIAGAGLQFVGGDDEFRRRLDACIEHLLSQES